jgi:hypothetical protein
VEGAEEVGRMWKKMGAGVLSIALLASGLFVGVSFGGPERIEDPQVIELTLGRELRNEQEGPLTQVRSELLDGERDRVGTIFCDSVYLTDWRISFVYRLRPIAGNPAGTIVATGIFRGFNGETLAVVGGTGGYANVRGSVTLTVVDDEFTHTLSLIP